MANVNKLNIVATDTSVVLERILQVTRYRGFKICSFTMLSHGDNEKIYIELSVKSDKSIENLKYQLAKIIDIQHIKVEDQLKQQITA